MCTQIISRWETAATSGDYLAMMACVDAIAILDSEFHGSDVSEDDRRFIDRAMTVLMRDRGWLAICNSESLSWRLETMEGLLSARGYWVRWDGGYDIFWQCSDESCTDIDQD
jgi:hypothetical protein